MRIVKHYKALLLIAIFLGGIINCIAQSSSPALLLKQLQHTGTDSDKVNIYCALSKDYANKKQDSALLLANKALEIAERIKYKKGIALAYQAKGEVLITLEKYPEALRCELSSLKAGEQLKMASIIEKAYANIALVYTALRNGPKALYYSLLSYNLAKSPNGTGLKSYNFLDLGNIYRMNEQYDSAIWFNSRAVEIERKEGDSLTVAIALFNISENYRKKNMFEKSLPYLDESLAISKRINDSVGFVFCNNAYGKIEYIRGNYDLSIKYFTKALNEANSIKNSEIKKSCYEYLSLIYRKLGNYKIALKYRDKEISITDSLNSIKREKEILSIVTDYQLEKQNARIVLLEKEKKLRDVEAKTDKWKIYILSAGVFLLIIAGFFIYKSYLQKNKLSVQLREHNTDILVKNKQLEELNNVKNKLFSIVSHDLRGPIGSVKGIMDLMHADMVTLGEIKMILPQLSGTLVQTSYLLDNLLYWAKSQMHGIQFNQKLFNINSLIEQNFRLLQSRANEKKITLLLEGSMDGLLVNADEPTIDIVTRNLLENAIKFSSEGDVIVVKTEVLDSKAHISVRDNGKGIPYTDQAKIFNTLTTHTTFGTANEKGSGLGLLLCKELVESNQGKIWFTSEPGKGSIFTFSLPI